MSEIFKIISNFFMKFTFSVTEMGVLIERAILTKF
jgi:hypothetical protein